MPRDPAATSDNSAPNPQNHALVIGGGFGGMAASLRLRAKGYHVTIVDRCPRLGGRAQVFEREGFRHDAGPTVITAPFLFEELFNLFGKKLANYVELVVPEQWYRFYFDEDQTQFDYGPTQEITEAEIAKVSPDDVRGYRRFNDHAKKIYDLAFTKLSDAPFHNPGLMVKYLPSLLRLRSYETVWQMISRFVKNDKVRRAFSIQPLLLGGNPYQTTSIYGLINHLEREHGVWFPMGGTGALVDGLATLMTEEGIDIRTNTTVDHIIIEDGIARGVMLDNGQAIRADVVVSNADPMHLYKHMLPPGVINTPATIRSRHARLSMGLYVLFFGADKQWPEVAHHTIWFGKRHKELLDDIFNRKVLADDFSLYLHRPTATDPSFAPAGADSFYVLCPVPNQQGDIDWAEEEPKLRQRIIEALDCSILPGLRDTIRAPFSMTPDNFAHDYLSAAGAGFSIAPHFTQSAWFRFHNRAETIPGLYLVGAGTHPGAGLPGVVCSAKVIDKLVPLAPGMASGMASEMPPGASAHKAHQATDHGSSQRVGSDGATNQAA
ncbi:MAG: phytoene desaturase family protein [Pseudomonadota bacterium]